MKESIKILIVDDSSLVRRFLKSFFTNDPDIEISDEAVDGRSAVEKIKANLGKYDVILLDYEMPHMNGLQVLKTIKNDTSINPKPSVLVFSSLTSTGSKQTIECLLAGAKDYISKPSRSVEGGGDLTELKKSIKDKVISIVSNVKAKSQPRIVPKAGVKNTQLTKNKLFSMSPGLLVIGSSTGGPAALETVLKDLPANFPCPILIVQHMPKNFTTILASTLDANCQIGVQEVTQKTIIKPGNAYLACGGKHMSMVSNNEVDVHIGEQVNYCMPAVDVLFKSVTQHYKKSVVSLILTGMGKDGLEGVRSLRSSLNCFSISQDQASSVVWAMPRVVYEAGLSDEVLDIDEIGKYLAGAICGIRN